MHSKPVIFISAVSGELKSARQLVANTLTFLGYEPDWQDIFGAEQGDLRGMLRRRIDASAGVVQLVGKCYGFEPHGADGVSPLPDAAFGRVSYTQYEALYAKQRGKPVWYFFLDGQFPADPHDPEPDELRKLQDAYRDRLHASGDLSHSAATPDSLQLRVHELRNDLGRLRRGVKRYAALVLLLLLLLAAGTAWVMHQQREGARSAEQTKKDVVDAKESAAKAERAATASMNETVKLRKSLNALPGAQAQALRQQPGQSLAQVEDSIYEAMAERLGIEPKKLRVELDALAQRLQAAPDTAPLERANAAYVAKDYAQAETLALTAADAALGAAPPRPAEAIQAYELAGQAAQQRIHYKDAVLHLRKAEHLADRQRDPKEWARVQFALARVLVADGDYRGAGAIFQEVVKEQTAALGPNDPATLLSRIWFGIALRKQGKSLEAEGELRSVVALETQYQGPDHPDTLKARNNLANVLGEQDKYVEAEQEFRGVLAIRERVLGPEHVDTLASRNNLAVELSNGGRDIEAEQEHRTVLAIRERVLGADHPDSLQSRVNLASALLGQRKYAEGEQELLAVLALYQRVLGPEHPDTLRSRSNLASVLLEQGKFAEAEQEHRLRIAIEERVLGPEHPETLQSRDDLARVLSAQGKDAEAEEEIRAVLAIRERMIGSEHLATLRSRHNLALALHAQGKDAEAEKEIRAMLAICKRTFPLEHPEILKSRHDLAVILADQGKHAEAEAECRAVLTIGERVLGREHTDVLRGYFNLALTLMDQKKYREALDFAKRAEEGMLKTLGPEDPASKKAKKNRERIEGKLKQAKGKKP